MYRLVKTLPVNKYPSLLDSYDQENMLRSILRTIHELVVCEVGNLGSPRGYYVRRSRAYGYDRFFWVSYEYRTHMEEYDRLRLQSVLVELFALPKPPPVNPKLRYSRVGFFAPITTEEGKKQLENYRWLLESKLTNRQKAQCA